MCSFNSHNKPTRTTPTQQIGKLCLQGVGDMPKSTELVKVHVPNLDPGAYSLGSSREGSASHTLNSTDDVEEEDTGEKKCRWSGSGMFTETGDSFLRHQLLTSTSVRKTFPHGSAYPSWDMRSDPQSQLSVVPWPPLASLRGFLEEVIQETAAGPRFYASASL